MATLVDRPYGSNSVNSASSSNSNSNNINLNSGREPLSVLIGGPVSPLAPLESDDYLPFTPNARQSNDSSNAGSRYYRQPLGGGAASSSTDGINSVENSHNRPSHQASASSPGYFANGVGNPERTPTRATVAELEGIDRDSSVHTRMVDAIGRMGTGGYGNTLEEEMRMQDPDLMTPGGSRGGTEGGGGARAGLDEVGYIAREEGGLDRFNLNGHSNGHDSDGHSNSSRSQHRYSQHLEDSGNLSAGAELRPEDAVDGDHSGISNTSSPADVDFDKPLVNKVSAPLQRGDSTSSDSSTSGLSRASSSSSVYATPFRMTPMRPVGTPSRPSSYIGNRAESYFNLVPTRYPGRGGAAGGGGGYVSARSSFSGPAGIPVRLQPPSTQPSPPNGIPISLPPLPDEETVINALGHRSQGSNATIGPPMNPITLVSLAQAEGHGANGSSQAEGLVASPPRPIPSTSRGSFSAHGRGSFSGPSGEMLASSTPLIRLPTTPSPESMLSASGPLTPGAFPRAIRPGLGSRTGSTASVNTVAHKRVTDFTLGEVIGEGSYSIVHLATDKTPPHRQYALKVLNKKHIIKERKVKYVNVEKETLARLDRHPGIIRLYWTFHDDQSLYFVLELAQNGEILKYLKDYGSFQVDVARFYAAQILSALEHMHRKGIVHRDVKPENILLDSKMRVKLADFGTAKILSSSPTVEKLSDEIAQSRANSFVGTAQYVCPELLTAKPIPDPSKDPAAAARALPPPHAADFWAFGCVLYQFIAGRTPFRAPNEYLIFQKITALDYEFPENFPEDAKDLIRRLLVLDPKDRLGTVNDVEDVKAHPFFASVDWSNIWTIDPPPFQTGITPPTILPRQILALEESSIEEHDISGEDGDAEEDSLAGPDEAETRSVGPADGQGPDEGSAPSAQGTPSIPWSPNGDYQYPSNFSTVRTHHRVSLSSSAGGQPEVERPSSRSTNGSWHRGDSIDRTRSRSSSQSRWTRFLSLPRSAMQKMKTPARRKSMSKVGS